MRDSQTHLLPVDARLIDDLYVEAMLLADEARAYLESGADAEREKMDAMARLNFSCEALKVTTRLMHVIAWLLSRRALARGEIDLDEARSDKFRLGEAAPSDMRICENFPLEMLNIVVVSESLYYRARQLEARFLDAAGLCEAGNSSPARDLIALLESSL